MGSPRPAAGGKSVAPGAGPARPFDFWFRPRRFESERLYERLGARLLKRYVPTGGDLAMQWIRRRRPGFKLVSRANPESLRRFERWTRVAEAVHEVGFVFFAALAAWRFAHGWRSAAGLGAALLLDLTFGLWPAVLQRYNRLRVNRVIEFAEAHAGEQEPDAAVAAPPRRTRISGRAEPPGSERRC